MRSLLSRLSHLASRAFGWYASRLDPQVADDGDRTSELPEEYPNPMTRESYSMVATRQPRVAEPVTEPPLAGSLRARYHEARRR